MPRLLPSTRKKKIPKTLITEKKVHFSDIVIIYEISNTKEDKAARNGLQELRDRDRFKRRIKHTSLLLDGYLNKLKERVFKRILRISFVFYVFKVFLVFKCFKYFFLF